METKKDNSLTLKYTIFLVIAVAVYSLSGFFSKKAALEEFLSLQYIVYFLGGVFVLGVYAVMWQIALKKVPLNRAYMFRSLGVVYGLTIAYFFFGESVSLQNLIGGALVISAVLIISIEK